MRFQSSLQMVINVLFGCYLAHWIILKLQRNSSNIFLKDQTKENEEEEKEILPSHQPSPPQKNNNIQQNNNKKLLPDFMRDEYVSRMRSFVGDETNFENFVNSHILVVS